MQGIYKIINTVNNKIYVGSSIQIKKRWSQHKTNLRRNKHHCKGLQNAWNKYGENSFILVITEEVLIKTDLAKREQYYIDLYKTYNNKFRYNSAVYVHERLAERTLDLNYSKKYSHSIKLIEITKEEYERQFIKPSWIEYQEIHGLILTDSDKEDYKRWLDSKNVIC